MVVIHVDVDVVLSPYSRYPQGVRVTSSVFVPGARSLLVSFDPRSKTETNADYLMFSQMHVGGDDLGLFSGDVCS